MIQGCRHRFTATWQTQKQHIRDASDDCRYSQNQQAGDGRRRNEMSYMQTDDCIGEMPLSISNKCVDTDGWHRSEMLYSRRRLRLQPVHENFREKLHRIARSMPFCQSPPRGTRPYSSVPRLSCRGLPPWFFSRPLTPGERCVEAGAVLSHLYRQHFRTGMSSHRT